MTLPQTPTPVSLRRPTRRRALVAAGLVLALAGAADRAEAARASQLAADSKAALAKLYSTHDKARALGAKARAILVFPKVYKAGMVVGGQGGEGALMVNGKATAFYRTAAASYGLQLGAQKYGYALFFMNDGALDYLKKSDGWSIGSGPSLVFVDEGYAKTMNTTTLKKDVYAVVFGQKGLMAGTGLEGTKITQIYPDP